MLLKIKRFLLPIYSKVYSFFNPLGYDKRFYTKGGYANIPESLNYYRENADVLILIEPRNFHHDYIKACEELAVEYVLLDLRDYDWLERIIQSKCKAILAWPSAASPLWKELFDERMQIVKNYLKLLVIPTYEETWMWESKKRMAYYFKSNKIQTPQTNIFYSYKQAIEFIEASAFPMVYKADHGDSSRGVKILKTKKQTVSLIEKAFGKGLRHGLNHALDIERGFVIFQEYLDFQEEWRIIRLDDLYFGYKKNKVGYFASGTGDAIFDEVPRSLLDTVKEITTRNNFTSMSFDIIIHDGNPYFIEAQSLFGPTRQGHKTELNGEIGAYKFCETEDTWSFIKGDFDRNNGCNLRVKNLLKQLKERNRCQDLH